jgi:hypothetical protein
MPDPTPTPSARIEERIAEMREEALPWKEEVRLYGKMDDPEAWKPSCPEYYHDSVNHFMRNSGLLRALEAATEALTRIESGDLSVHEEKAVCRHVLSAIAAHLEEGK